MPGCCRVASALADQGEPKTFGTAILQSSSPLDMQVWSPCAIDNPMRLRSDIWVKAYLRTCAASGAHAVVVRHGDDDAGAIYIKVSRLDGTAMAFGPAPAGWDGAATDRRWIALTGATQHPERDVDEMLRRESEFDPDVWIVEVEDKSGRNFLDGWLDDRGA